jgi:hypothetical protein
MGKNLKKKFGFTEVNTQSSWPIPETGNLPRMSKKDLGSGFDHLRSLKKQ